MTVSTAISRRLSTTASACAVPHGLETTKDMELYSDEQLIFLLSLFDPLDQMRDHLAQEQEADQMEQVNDAIRCLQKELQESQKIKTPGQGGMSMK